ncbi:MAG: hypothetical protein LUQ50_14775, partial [Methanospirillum sp.]|nr:hypothetical protein [Methanospirillum sp.]
MNRILVITLILTWIFVGYANAETLNPGGPYMVGDLISIHGDTNYNTDNRILIEVYPASFGPTKKYEPSMTGGASMVVPVVTGREGGYSWSVNVSSENWVPDQYMVRAEIIGKDYRESAIITLNEKGSQSDILHTNLSAHDTGGVSSQVSSVPSKRETQLPGETG